MGGMDPKMWRRRRRHRVGRPHKPRIIRSALESRITFVPHRGGLPVRGVPPITLEPDELEALRLVYLEEHTQEEAARKMGISRGTLWRILEGARKKVVAALVEGRPLELSPE